MEAFRKALWESMGEIPNKEKWEVIIREIEELIERICVKTCGRIPETIAEYNRCKEAKCPCYYLNENFNYHRKMKWYILFFGVFGDLRRAQELYEKGVLPENG